MNDQGGKDHTEGQEDDNVAIGKGRTFLAYRERQGQCCRQRNDAAHSRPGYNANQTLVGPRLPLPDSSTEPSWQIRAWINPNDAHQDCRHTDQDSVSQQPTDRKAVQVFCNQVQLKSDENENNSIQKKDDNFPYEIGLQACLMIEDLGGTLAQIQSRHHHRQYTGCMELFGQ